MTRIARLQARMKETGTDLVVLAPGAHMAWLMDVRPHADERAVLACISQSTTAFLMPALEADSAREQTDLPFYEWADAEGPGAALDRLLADLGTGNAGAYVLDETMRADHAALVQDRLLNAKRSFTEGTVGALRMRKDDAEYALLKRNAQIADTAMEAAWAAMKPGMSETQVADIIRQSFDDQGAKQLFTIVGAGRNGAFPHHHTGETVLQDGDAVVMDIGAGIDGYVSDITRMAIMGEPPEGFAEVHAVVNAAVKAALAAARPGVPAHVVDDAARKVIAEAGYGDYFLHRTGHGLGTEVHEPPYITSTADTLLDEGMVFSIEPGIYLPDRFGLRLEEIVILRADGPEILSDLPRAARVITP
ncbi:MAG: Xaa-Pro peptidase family protein [Silicimonas sp.]|nr:Xaa-Pro peptidase family protein [Silicimonas sp.]